MHKCMQCGLEQDLGATDNQWQRQAVYRSAGWSFWRKRTGGYAPLCRECTEAIKRDWEERMSDDHGE